VEENPLSRVTAAVEVGVAAGVVAVVVVAVVVAGEVTRVKTPLERVARAVLSEGSEKKRMRHLSHHLSIL